MSELVEIPDFQDVDGEIEEMLESDQTCPKCGEAWPYYVEMCSCGYNYIDAWHDGLEAMYAGPDNPEPDKICLLCGKGHNADARQCECGYYFLDSWIDQLDYEVIPAPQPKNKLQALQWSLRYWLYKKIGRIL